MRQPQPNKGSRNNISYSTRTIGYLGVMLVMVLPAVYFSGCDGSGLQAIQAFPEMSGCPGVVDPDTPVTLTVLISDGSLLGVAVASAVNATVVSTRQDAQTFILTVTAEGIGDVAVTVNADSDLHSSSTQLTCEYEVALGACCDVSTCEEIVAAQCDSSKTYMGPGTTCVPNPCLGACCGISVNGVTSCAEMQESSCTDLSGTFMGDGSLCEDGCLCETVADCPEGLGCEFRVCEGGVCGLRSVCAGGTPCLMPDTCPINITSAAFPDTLQNGQSADLSIAWESLNAHSIKTGQFFAVFGTCPEGFACASKTLTLQNANPFVIPDAFKCSIGDSMTSVVFTYEAILTDANGVGSNRAVVTITCLP